LKFFRFLKFFEIFKNEKITLNIKFVIFCDKQICMSSFAKKRKNKKAKSVALAPFMIM